MSDFPATDREAPRRAGRRLGLVTIFVSLALLVGIALMVYATRDTHGWFAPAKPVETAQAPAPAPAPVVPSAAPVAAQPVPQTLTSAVDPVTLAAREATLAAQLGNLEARTAAISADANAAATQAGRAESILIAFAARRALDRGVGLGYLEEQLRLRFGTSQPAATLTVIQASRQPVTIEDLRQGLDANAAVLTSGGGDWFSNMAQSLRTLVVLHRAGTPSPLPADRLARARRMMEAGQVDAARAEIERLPGAPEAANWSAAARRYVEARQALDLLEGTAILGPVAATR